MVVVSAFQLWEQIKLQAKMVADIEKKLQHWNLPFKTLTCYCICAIAKTLYVVMKIASDDLFWKSIRSALCWFLVLMCTCVPRGSALTFSASSLCQMVVLCFAVVFGSFSQSYGPYPSATKMVLPRQHSSPESYTDSIGKWQPSQSWSLAWLCFSTCFLLPTLTPSSSTSCFSAP